MFVYKILLYLLFFTLPFLHGKIFYTLGLQLGFNVEGNFEFTKVIFFNITCALIGLSYLGEKLLSKKSISVHAMKVLVFICAAGLISSICSFSPLHSLIADIEKGHTFIGLVNLVLLYIILAGEDTSELKKLIKISIMSLVGVSLLSVKELLFPTYDYGELSSRIVGSFGHPNYYSGFSLLLLPLLINLKDNYKKYIAIVIVFIALLLSQSLTAIFLAIMYITYEGTKKRVSTLFFLLFAASLSLAILVMLGVYYPEKLHSFISRFYLWETTLKIVLSNSSLFFVGGGSETLNFLFNSYKSPELYIFENFGYSSDRPHNFFLNILYHYGVLALGLLTYLIYIFKRSWKNTPYHMSILLFLLFGIFQYYSIASYCILVLIIAYISRKAKSSHKLSSIVFVSILSLTSAAGGYASIQLYTGEIQYKSGKYIQAIKSFPHPRYFIKTADYQSAVKYGKIQDTQLLRRKISLGEDKAKLCSDLMSAYPSIENYFYCGKKLEQIGNHTQAKKYYNLGLEKLPDLWNNDSIYWDNYFIKHTITGNRFFSEKFGDINRILEFVGK